MTCVLVAVIPATGQRPPIDASSVLADADTFAFVANGQTIGTQVMTLEDGATYALPVFSSCKNELKSYTLRVAAREEVTIPTGKHEPFRGEASGGEPSLVLYVSAAAPRRLLRLEVVGNPIQVVRTSGGPH